MGHDSGQHTPSHKDCCCKALGRLTSPSVPTLLNVQLFWIRIFTTNTVAIISSFTHFHPAALSANMLSNRLGLILKLADLTATLCNRDLELGRLPKASAHPNSSHPQSSLVAFTPSKKRVTCRFRFSPPRHHRLNHSFKKHRVPLLQKKHPQLLLQRRHLLRCSPTP